MAGDFAAVKFLYKVFYQRRIEDNLGKTGKKKEKKVEIETALNSYLGPIDFGLI